MQEEKEARTNGCTNDYVRKRTNEPTNVCHTFQVRMHDRTEPKDELSDAKNPAVVTIRFCETRKIKHLKSSRAKNGEPVECLFSYHPT